MAGLLIWAIVVQLSAARGWGHGSWQMTEWLINYSGGFVRRGLIGSVVWHLSTWTGMRATWLIIGLSLLCYVGLAGWLLRRASGIFPVALILSCVVMGLPGYQDAIIRKDCLGLLLLLCCLRIEASQQQRWVAWGVINLLAVIAILTHEAFVFYALPPLVLLTGVGTASGIGGMVRRAVVMLPAIGCFCLVSIYHGTPATAVAVNDSWLELWRQLEPAGVCLEEPAASIAALGWTTEYGLSLAIYLLTSGPYQPVAWAAMFGISFGLVVWFTGRAFGTAERVVLRARMAALLVVQLACISPLFVLGVDYGRWLFLWVVSSMISLTMGRSAPGWVEARVTRVFTIIRVDHWMTVFAARDWYLLLFGVPVCWTSFNYLTSSPLGRLIWWLAGLVSR